MAMLTNKEVLTDHYVGLGECTDSSGVETSISLGKVYVLYRDHESNEWTKIGNTVTTYDDRGVGCWFYINRFKIISTTKLAKVLYS